MVSLENDSPHDRIDPRVIRTRARVLSEARGLMEEGGSAAINYLVLASRSGVTRPTLYRHWPTLSALLRDLVPAAAPADQFAESGDGRQELVEYLKQVRREVSRPGGAGPFVALANLADRKEVALSSLKSAVAAREQILNKVLGGTGRPLTSSDVAQLVGPLIFCRLVQRVNISNTLIEKVVDRWLSFRPL